MNRDEFKKAMRDKNIEARDCRIFELESQVKRQNDLLNEYSRYSRIKSQIIEDQTKSNLDLQVERNNLDAENKQLQEKCNKLEESKYWKTFQDLETKYVKLSDENKELNEYNESLKEQLEDNNRKLEQSALDIHWFNINAALYKKLIEQYKNDIEELKNKPSIVNSVDKGRLFRTIIELVGDSRHDFRSDVALLHLLYGFADKEFSTDISNYEPYEVN